MKSLALIALAGCAVLAGCASNGGTPPTSQAARTKSCKVTTEQEIVSLFDRWNQSLQTGDPHKVVANYAERSILLPTVSNKPCLTPAEKEDYFHHFLENRPSGKIDLPALRVGEVGGCTRAEHQGPVGRVAAVQRFTGNPSPLVSGVPRWDTSCALAYNALPAT
ncbi:MAG: DUF4440 domain-containing protein [Gammaproteobacteria bacterium]